jgi:hypothetical protein
MIHPSEDKAFILGAGFSRAEQFPLVSGLRAGVIHFIEAEQHSAYRVFLQPGNGGFSKGQFYEGLERIDPTHEMEFEELLIALSKQCHAASFGVSKTQSATRRRAIRTSPSGLSANESLWLFLSTGTSFLKNR